VFSDLHASAPFNLQHQHIIIRTLVSSGAEKFATGNHVETVLPEALISPYAYDVWRKWKQRLESADKEPLAVEDEETLADIQDTVGAVAFHEQDGLASGVSRYEHNERLSLRLKGNVVVDFC
jgi:isoaspartyl peptidase/L-asparaginase-like protein (Ntn-hydrolase superfamily)